MPQYLTETYAPAASSRNLVDSVRRLEAAASELGASVHHVRSIAVPGDETLFHLFEAPSVADVEAVGRLADLAFDRVTEAVEESKG